MVPFTGRNWIQNSMKAKAVCVMRTDLRNSDGFKVPKGKLIAQGGHAFVGLILKISHPSRYLLVTFLEPDSPEEVWINNEFTKVVLAVDSEEELLEIYEKAKEAGLNTVLITDAGHTEFSEPTNTCVGIGPAWSEDIDKITGHLKGYS